MATFNAWADDDLGWDHDTGAPGLTLFSNALQVWCAMQDRTDVTVDEAAVAFKVTPRQIKQAVNAHYWMYLEGDVIMHEGE